MELLVLPSKISGSEALEFTGCINNLKLMHPQIEYHRLGPSLYGAANDFILHGYQDM